MNRHDQGQTLITLCARTPASKDSDTSSRLSRQMTSMSIQPRPWMNRFAHQHVCMHESVCIHTHTCIVRTCMCICIYIKVCMYIFKTCMHLSHIPQFQLMACRSSYKHLVIEIPKQTFTNPANPKHIATDDTCCIRVTDSLQDSCFPPIPPPQQHQSNHRGAEVGKRRLQRQCGGLAKAGPCALPDRG